MRLRSCRFFSNAAGAGGGVYVAGSVSSFFPEILVNGAEADLIDCEFSQNWVSSVGGGVIIYWSRVLFDSCTLADNVAMNYGGGVFNSSGRAELIDTELKDNFAGGSGGGIYCGSGTNISNGSLVLFGCVLSENRSDGRFQSDGGGAIRIDGIRSVELINNLFIGNSARWNGGAVLHDQSLISIVNCTAHGNQAYLGRFLSSEIHFGPKQAIVILENCIIDNGGNEFRFDSVPESNSLLEIRYTNIPVVDFSTEDNLEIGFIWGPGNLSVDPQFVNPGYWEDNGTPGYFIDDVFKPGDYHLKSQAGRWDPISETWVMDNTTSPCIDSGDPLALLGDELFPHGDRINMGAYGGTVEASLSYDSNLTPEPNMPEPPDDPNNGGNNGGGGGGGR